jgi:diguanylate cyclase
VRIPVGAPWWSNDEAGSARRVRTAGPWLGAAVLFAVTVGALLGLGNLEQRAQDARRHLDAARTELRAQAAARQDGTAAASAGSYDRMDAELRAAEVNLAQRERNARLVGEVGTGVVALAAMAAAALLARRRRVTSLRHDSERELRRRIEHQALHDALTGLPNRRLLLERLREATDAREAADAFVEPGRGTALLYLDLDGFKTVNDSMGHAAGDRLLQEVGRRLLAGVRPMDTVCRIGGDEFAVLLDDVDLGHARQVAERLVQALGEDLEIDGRLARTAVSIGIATTADTGIRGEEPLRGEELFMAADMAMYAAKREGRSRIAHYRRDMYEAMVRRTGMQRDLHYALTRGEISVVYQPIVTIRSVPGSPERPPITGVEALMRWTSPTWGSVSPAEFIPIAEDTGLIVPLGAYILREAATTVARWNTERPLKDALDLSVNVSVRQIETDGFVETVERVLAETGLAGALLTTEVTESLLIHDNCAPVLARLRDLGVRISLDDFGTGYAALGHLNALTVDQLKIDISFVRALGREQGKEQLTASILNLAASLGLDTVAEGVESADQLHHLQDMGCPHAQGYLFSRPLAGDALSELLRPATPRVQERPAGHPG